ncbi:MAG: cobalt-precorrin-5B (C(1))-methyltransferase [Paracoccaceae bacterium]
MAKASGKGVVRPETDAGTDGGARPLRTGFTTGACATAAAAAAYHALLTGHFPDPVEIVLPRGQRVAFALARRTLGRACAAAGVIKDAGDDPDVTHGVEVIATLSAGPAGTGVTFRAGPGVGTVTKPGLPIAPGEPAINPVPRRMIAEAISGLAAAHRAPPDIAVEIAIPGGAEIARRTWNPRLGIEGGLSILGTTGIVRPFSCAAWIASIHRGIDVARANGAPHAVGATGATSEATAQARYGLPDWAMLDMGDFAGGLLKYLARHPIPRLTIAGGIGKLTKLAQGALDLHSRRSQVDFTVLARLAETRGLDPRPVAAANTALDALGHGGPALAEAVAVAARATARRALGAAPVAVSVLVVGRAGEVLAETPPLGPDARER